MARNHLRGETEDRPDEESVFDWMSDPVINGIAIVWVGGWGERLGSNPLARGGVKKTWRDIGSCSKSWVHDGLTIYT